MRPCVRVKAARARSGAETGFQGNRRGARRRRPMRGRVKAACALGWRVEMRRGGEDRCRCLDGRGDCCVRTRALNDVEARLRRAVETVAAFMRRRFICVGVMRRHSAMIMAGLHGGAGGVMRRRSVIHRRGGDMRRAGAGGLQRAHKGEHHRKNHMCHGAHHYSAGAILLFCRISIM